MLDKHHSFIITINKLITHSFIHSLKSRPMLARNVKQANCSLAQYKPLFTWPSYVCVCVRTYAR